MEKFSLGLTKFFQIRKKSNMTNDPINQSPESPRHRFDINLMLVMPPALTVRSVPFNLLIMDTPAWALHLRDWHKREAAEALAAGFPDVHEWYTQIYTSVDHWLATGQGIVTEHLFLAQRQLLRPWVVGQTDISQYCRTVLENSEAPVCRGVDVLLMVDEKEAAMFTKIPVVAAHSGDYVRATQVNEEKMQMLVQRFVAMLEEPL